MGQQENQDLSKEEAELLIQSINEVEREEATESKQPSPERDSDTKS